MPSDLNQSNQPTRDGGSGGVDFPQGQRPGSHRPQGGTGYEGLLTSGVEIPKIDATNALFEDETGRIADPDGSIGGRLVVVVDAVVVGVHLHREDLLGMLLSHHVTIEEPVNLPETKQHRLIMV